MSVRGDKEQVESEVTSPPAAQFPTTIGGCLAELAKVRRLKEAAESRAKPFAQREEALRAHILDTFSKDDIKGARGSGLSLSIVMTKVPKIADWDLFFRFARKKGNEDLINRAVNSGAWRERMEDGKAVPGVDVFNNVSLRVNALKGKKE